MTEAILNHVSGSRSGITGIYQRYSYDREKVEALAQWADYLATLTGGNIVPLMRA